MKGQRKPTVLKLIDGEKNKDRIPKNEPKPRPVSPEPPAHLDDYAKAEWLRMAPILERLGLLTEVDGASFAAYCEIYSLSIQTSRDWESKGRPMTTTKVIVDKKGTSFVEEKAHPLVIQKQNILMKLRPYIAEFGLSPASRSKVVAPKMGDMDAYEALLD